MKYVPPLPAARSATSVESGANHSAFHCPDPGHFHISKADLLLIRFVILCSRQPVLMSGLFYPLIPFPLS